MEVHDRSQSMTCRFLQLKPPEECSTSGREWVDSVWDQTSHDYQIGLFLTSFKVSKAPKVCHIKSKRDCPIQWFLSYRHTIGINTIHFQIKPCLPLHLSAGHG
jgi:hypothetical protein